jgi:hypothetical protein
MTADAASAFSSECIGFVMVSPVVFLLEENHEPTFRHKAGEVLRSNQGGSDLRRPGERRDPWRERKSAHRGAVLSRLGAGVKDFFKYQHWWLGPGIRRDDSWSGGVRC